MFEKAGKIYDVTTNSFRMVEMNDNTNNITTFEVKNDNLLLSINTGSSYNITNYGATDNSRLLSKTENLVLLAKIIILYDDQTDQSMIKNTDAIEPYNEMMYIGIM